MNEQQTYRIVLVLKTGGDFSFKDVELLARNIRKHWPQGVPLDIVCLYNKVRKEIRLNGLRLLPLKYDLPGWWSKLNLFAPEFAYLRPFLYIDLDTVVLDIPEDLPGLKTAENRFICLEDFYRKNKCASGMLYIPANSDQVQAVWDKWDKRLKKGRLDYFIEECVKGKTFFQQLTNQITTFKPKGKGWRKTRPQESIICFHGKPRIWEAAKTVSWVRDYIQPGDEMKGYVISLAKRKEKLQNFFSQSFPFPITIFVGIEMSNGKDGCRESHYSVLRQMKEFPSVVFEDDAELLVDWSVVKQAIKQLPKDWDLLYLGGNLHIPLSRYSENLFHLQGAKTSHAIMYGSKRVVDYILKNGQGKKKDMFYMEQVQPRFNCFIINPMAFTQRGGWSDIQNARRDHKKLMERNYMKYTTT